MEKTMDEAISYLRWSTPEQSWGDSDRRQIEWAQSWIEKNNVRLAEVYRDSGLSAFRGKNRSKGALGEFLEAIRSGKLRPKYLIVENLDRLSRDDPFEAFDLLREIVKSGITLVTRSQVYSTTEFRTNPYILQQALGEMIRAHSESQRKSEMLISSHEQKRKLAREKKIPVTSTGPFWLRLEGEGRREDQKFVPIPERVAVVNRIFDECIAGIGLWKIARRLNQDGIITPKAGKRGWQKSTVNQIVKNRVSATTNHASASTVGDSLTENRFPTTSRQLSMSAALVSPRWL
jgi:DNA invertase Pin-like site-specific DNA recombinase